MRRSSLALAVAAVATLVAAGCGDDDRPPVDAGPTMDGEVPDGGGTDGEVPDGGGTDGGTVPECWVPDTPGPTVTTCDDTLVPPGDGTCEVTAGTGGATLLVGDVLTPGEVLHGGQVLVDATGTITCVACDCTGEAGAGTATRVTCAQGVISPGLIDPHEHITFEAPPAAASDERYEHRHDWREGHDGHTEITSGGSTSGAGVIWGELRHLLGGATSVNGSGTGTGLLRNLDRASGLLDLDGLEQDVDYDTFPLADSSGTERVGDCSYSSSRTTAADIASDDSYTPHIAEGIEESAHNEFICSSMEGGEFDLIEPQTAVIHGIAMTGTDINTMSAEGSSLIWSPRSNISLYGDTARVPTYANLGVRIALGTDWLRSGSMNMLRELACADQLNTDYFNGYFTDEQLWLMATRDAAASLGMESIGVLQPGEKADIAIFDGSEHADHRAIIEATSADVVLVLRSGSPLYGDDALVSSLASGSCDLLDDVCGTAKRVCVGDTGYSLSEIMAAGPSYQIFSCGVPTGEPTCVPFRNSDSPEASIMGSTEYTGVPTDGDMDGDGVPDAEDNCVCTFNPIRPMDEGVQMDSDGDGFGDECDPCPLSDTGFDCEPPDPEDIDGDGVPNVDDNCPADANPGQEDADGDGKGDVCDPCPDAPNPGVAACPVTIYDIKDGTVADGSPVNVSGALVTAVASNGFVMQVDPAATDYAGAPYSGVFVYTGGAPTVSRGNRVDIPNGTVGSYMGQIQVSYFDPVSVTESGVTLPAPVSVTASEVADGGARAAELEGVLVELTDAEVTAVTGTDFEVDSALPVNGFLFAVSPTPIVGEVIATLRGVLAMRGSSQLWPRDDADFVFGAPTLAALEPALSFAHLGATGSPTYPDPLTVRLTRAVSADTVVTITSSDPTGLGVTDVTVSAGSNTAVVPVDANTASPTPYTVTAMLGADSATADVRVLDGTEVPVLVDLRPGTATVPTDTTYDFTVELDIPAPTGGTDVLLSVDTGGTVPASVTVPADALTADFTFTAGSAAASATITATLNTDMYTSAVDVVEGSSAPVVINEVDYDQPGSDTDEFIELYNRSGATVDLSAYQLVLVNGSSGATYDTIDLTGTLAADGYLVVASSTVTVDSGATVITFSSATDNVQNGAPDGIVLWDTASGSVVDALSYEGSITDVTVDGVGGVSLVEGTAATAEDAAADGSLSRLPNGTDTDDADMDWAFTTTPTPGTANVP